MLSACWEDLCSLQTSVLCVEWGKLPTRLGLALHLAAMAAFAMCPMLLTHHSAWLSLGQLVYVNLPWVLCSLAMLLVSKHA